MTPHHEFCTLCIKWPSHCVGMCDMVRRAKTAEKKANTLDEIQRMLREVYGL